MKISKLFHWLYAILMFLPILVFIPNAFYYGFNETAVAQEKTEQVPVYYETNVVDSLDDIIVGNVYTWNNNISPLQIGNEIRLFSCEILNTEYQGSQALFYITSSGYTAINSSSPSYFRSVVNFPFDFKLLDYENGFSDMPSVVLEKIGSCKHDYIKTHNIIDTNMSITDSMSYAWHTTWQNDLFSWSYGSFLTQPFLYITNLFNVPATNTLLYCLSYWLNISIIWLCFDVVMYVPLLVHRWLDKGIVE